MDHPSSTILSAGPTSLGTVYTTQEVAKLLKVSQRTVQFWIRDGQLPAVRYGHLLRVREADLVTFGEVLNQPAAPTTDPAPA